MIVSEDQKKALVGYYRVMQPVNVGFKRLKLKGLKEDTCYKVSGYDYDCYGDELMQVGMILSDSASGVWKKGVNDKGDFRRKCLRLWLCKPEYMGRTKWENRFVLLRFRKKNYMMFLKDLKRFKMERLYDKLKAYSESDFYAFHMPGHKRNKALLGIELPYDLDITEIDGFDDLHHADGILKEEQERAARVFGAEESHFLVNGSTAGILSAVMGCTHRGDKILVARHCHKSIYHAIYMNGLVPRYVYPEFDISMHMNGEIRKEDVAKALAAEPDIKAVVIVSPNYDGVVSDVKGIAEVAHSYRIPLIVDEAHGPHFGFHPAFPGAQMIWEQMW